MNQRIQNRGAGRQQAKTILGVVDLPTPDHIDAFIDELESTLRPQRKAEELEKAQRKLSELLKWQMPFGIHNGKTLDEIPRDYLHWLSSSSEETKGIVDEYLEVTKCEDDSDD